MSMLQKLVHTQNRLWWRLGCTSAAIAVAVGAIGAHFVTPTDKFEQTFKTGSQYHFIHSIGLLFVSQSQSWQKQHWKYLRPSGLLFTFGIFFFCGSLYCVSIIGDRSYGKTAPYGGMAFIFGWLFLAFGL